MVLYSLAMNLDTLSESATALWAIVGTAGGMTGLSILTFIKTTVSNKKFSKLSDFAVVADQSIKFAKNEMISLKNEIINETKKQIVDPLMVQVKALVSDNTQMASLVVSLLSYIPLPLEVKKPTVEVIKTLGNITDEVKTLLIASIEQQEKQALVETQKSTQLNETIEGI